MLSFAGLGGYMAHNRFHVLCGWRYSWACSIQGMLRSFHLRFDLLTSYLEIGGGPIGS
jgi:hypothetical protein